MIDFDKIQFSEPEQQPQGYVINAEIVLDWHMTIGADEIHWYGARVVEEAKQILRAELAHACYGDLHPALSKLQRTVVENWGNSPCAIIEAFTEFRRLIPR